MKLIVVKCPKNKKVQVEDRGTGGAACPKNCPMKKNSRCFNNTFRYTTPMSASVVPDIPYSGDGAPSVEPMTTVSRVSEAKPVPVAEPHSTVSSRIPHAEPNGAVMPKATDSDYPVFEDLYADDGSVTEYSPFADTEYDEPAPAASEPRQKKKSILDKYNDVLTSDNSIFSAVRSRSDSEPCFIDGAYRFYERAPVGVKSEGNSKTAMRYIFRHWYVSRVFNEDGTAYREDFLYLLKLCGFKNSEDKLCEIVNDVKLSKNQKFFRLFYTVVYKNQINGFYWNDSDSPFNQLSPRLVSIDDFYNKLAGVYDPADFMYSFRNCFDELVYFLRSFTSMENAREWFKKTVPQIIAEKCSRLVYVSDKNGEISVITFGSFREFVSGMVKPSSYESMQQKCDFFKDFEITSGYKLMPRRNKLEASKRASTEDDSVYEILGITGYTSSQCATAYDNYMTILREYMRVFKPEKLTLGKLSFSSRNFYNEVLSIMKDAGAYLSVNKNATFSEVKIFHAVQSLFARGIFESFENSCETEKLKDLKKIYESSTVSIKDYFSCRDIEHEVYVGGYRITVSEYISRIVNENAGHILGSLNDKILEGYFSVNVQKESEKLVCDEINKLMKKQKELIGKF
jgi:hypothetical protein